MAEVLRLGVLRHETPATAAAAPPVTTALTEWRCGNCRALLARVAVAPDSLVQVKCLRCKSWNCFQT